jgi:hypothetical protein
MSGRSDLPARDFQTRSESSSTRLHAQSVPLVAFDVQQPRVVRIERLAVDVDRREQRWSVYRRGGTARTRLHAQSVPLVAFDVQQPRVVRIERLAVDVDRRRRSQREFGFGGRVATGGARKHAQTRPIATVDWRVRSAS